MVVGVQALRHGLVGIEQGALLGGVLSNMLFVLGLSFLLGGLATGRGQVCVTLSVTDHEFTARLSAGA